MPLRRARLAIVGAVATEERFRGQGHSRQALERIELAACGAGAEGLILWSDQEEFYAKAGFTRVGRQQIYALGAMKEPASLAPGRAVFGWDETLVRALYEKHPMRLDRPDSYWKAISDITSCTRVQWCDPAGRVLAYLAYDRGHDLQGIVHEWGGEADALLSLVWTVLRNRPNLMWLTHPRMPDPISPLLGEPLVDGSLALLKSFGSSTTAEELADAWFWGLDSL
jgi:hypothetical protein